MKALFCAAALLLMAAGTVTANSGVKRQMEFGVEMALKGSWREAAFRFEKVVRQDPDNPLAHNNLGVALESTGRFEEALAAYERALELDPRNRKIEENLDRLKAYMATRSQPGYVTAASREAREEKEDEDEP